MHVSAIYSYPLQQYIHYTRLQIGRLTGIEWSEQAANWY